MIWLRKPSNLRSGEEATRSNRRYKIVDIKCKNPAIPVMDGKARKFSSRYKILEGAGFGTSPSV
jgi:hypothetical protein